MPQHRTVEMVGRRFGKWTVLRRAGNRVGVANSAATWWVRCDCGTECERVGLNLRSGRTKGCGKCFDKSAHGRELARRYSGPNHARWKGGRILDAHGYVRMRRNMIELAYPRAVIVGDRAYEHVAVMSAHLGRALLPKETIHHKNGIRSDNRIENLELRVGNHGPGQSTEAVTAWAVEILRRYAPEFLALKESKSA